MIVFLCTVGGSLWLMNNATVAEGCNCLWLWQR